MNEFITTNVSYILLEELETRHLEATRKCLENYKTYVMETVHFEYEFTDMKNTITDIYENLLLNVKKQNKNYIQVMKDTAYNNYLIVLKKVNAIKTLKPLKRKLFLYNLYIEVLR